MLVKKTERKTQRNNFGTFFGWGFHYRTVFDLLNAVSPHSENAQEASALIETDLNHNDLHDGSHAPSHLAHLTTPNRSPRYRPNTKRLTTAIDDWGQIYGLCAGCRAGLSTCLCATAADRWPQGFLPCLPGPWRAVGAASAASAYRTSAQAALDTPATVALWTGHENRTPAGRVPPAYG
jgi:hypothetical protein